MSSLQRTVTESLDMAAYAAGGPRANDMEISYFSLSFLKPEHRKSYAQFRMDESSVLVQFGTVIVLLFGLAEVLLTSSANGGGFSIAEIVCTMFLIIAVLCSILFTLSLCIHKKMLSCTHCGKIDPRIVCNTGILAIMLHAVISQIFGGPDEYFFNVLKVMSAMVFMQAIYRLADWGAVALSAVLGVIALLMCAIATHIQTKVMGLMVVFGFLCCMVLYEVNITKLFWFFQYTNLEHVTRVAVEHEHRLNNAVLVSKELRSFVGNIAHDLKTPLQGFVSELDGLSHTEDKAVIDKTISSLQAICATMNMLINRSLDFVKCDSGVPLTRSDVIVDLKAVLKLTQNVASEMSTGPSITISPLPPSVNTHIMTDKTWLEDNLLCLLSNSIAYTPSGSIVVSVYSISENTAKYFWQRTGGSSLSVCESDMEIFGSIISDTEGGGDSSSMTLLPLRPNDIVTPSSPLDSPRKEMLMFEVEDTGVGIPLERRKLLFKNVVQTYRKTGGSGLGLFALAKRIEALGGMYGARGRRDKAQGSLIWFAIPYNPEESIAAPLAVSSLPPVHKILNILLVDDAPIIQKTTSRALKREGHSVTVALNGAVCLEKLETGTYDLVLMDIQMPVMDGLEAIRHIRANESKDYLKRSSRPPSRPLFVIGISAFSDTDAREVALAAGMNDFITKPLNMANLKMCCQKHGFKF